MNVSLKNNLSKQLLSIALIMCGIFFISLVFFLPNLLTPVYESSIYHSLEQPLYFIDSNIENALSDIAYIYINDDDRIFNSNNLSSIIDLGIDEIINNITDTYGKFIYNNNYYYYHTVEGINNTKISITNDVYIKGLKQDIILVVFPIVILTFILVAALILWWSRRLVLNIESLKNKIDNIDNDEFVDKYVYTTDDELSVLSKAIDEMKISLKMQEEYKNSMYQNISHDFKTPLAVIKSYIEAAEDGIESYDNSFKVIEEQVSKLEVKVHGLLYLNKLNYIKDIKDYRSEKVNVSSIIIDSVSKFKLLNKDIDFKVDFIDKNVEYNGNYDMWEAILDNILSNFIRYAKKNIRISVKEDRMVLYNDGDNIEQDILDKMFMPYKKGVSGQFGLGLSIVKKSLLILGYRVIVKNEKKGVSFIIQR